MLCACSSEERTSSGIADGAVSDVDDEVSSRW